MKSLYLWWEEICSPVVYRLLPMDTVWWYLLFFGRWTSNSSAHTLLACSKFTDWCVCRSWCTSSCMPLSKHGWVQVRKVKISFLLFSLNKVVSEAWLFLFLMVFLCLKKKGARWEYFWYSLLCVSFLSLLGWGAFLISYLLVTSCYFSGRMISAMECVWLGRILVYGK